MSSTTATIDETKTGSASASSSLMLAIACLLIALVGVYVPWGMRHAQATFEDFDIQFPRATVLMISIPDVAYYAAAGLAIGSMIVVHGSARRSCAKSLYYVLWIVLGLLVLGAYLIAFVFPMTQLMHGVGG